MAQRLLVHLQVVQVVQVQQALLQVHQLHMLVVAVVEQTIVFPQLMGQQGLEAVV
tara:strand:- start:115 stop:279 length:165 start_codon:yes stop_codon:yes gene_type:complete